MPDEQAFSDAAFRRFGVSAVLRFGVSAFRRLAFRAFGVLAFWSVAFGRFGRFGRFGVLLSCASRGVLAFSVLAFCWFVFNWRFAKGVWRFDGPAMLGSVVPAWQTPLGHAAP